jgi:thiol:disulfide interchange protein
MICRHNDELKTSIRKINVARHSLARRRLLLGIAAAFCAPLCALAASEVFSLPQDFDPVRNPAQDLEVALRIARAAGRNVLVDVGGEWCSWCHILDRFFTTHPELKHLRDANFIWLKVNWSKENKNEAFLRRWPAIAGYPHFFVLDGNGRLLHSQDTAVLETTKDYDPVAMRAFLVKWAPSK